MNNFTALFEALNKYQIKYVLFGTLGAIAYGAKLTTQDADICPGPEVSPENLQRLVCLLQEIKARPIPTLGFITVEESNHWRPIPPTIENLDHLFETTLGRLDICPYPYGSKGKENRHTYESLNQYAVMRLALGTQVRVAHLDNIIASKMSTQRQKDKAVFAELMRLKNQDLSSLSSLSSSSA